MKKQSGQVIVEYVLLMVIAVSLAVLLTKQLVSRNEDEPGVLTSKWQSILGEIAEDQPDSGE